MGLIMSGVDYKTADVATRERFSHTSTAVWETLEQIKADPRVEGCVLLSTCNRTELYLSCDDDCMASPMELLCGALDLDIRQYEDSFFSREGHRALNHLMMVAAGLRSQIRGEDQILAQVKTAVELAREIRATDPVLETMFRCAVSAAKKAKTLAPLTHLESSVATRAVEVLREQGESLEGKQALVIGNGKMGQLAASLLVRQGCRVTVTLRSYRHGEINVPQGCGTVSYDDRYVAVADCEILVSATTSPHYTVTADKLGTNSPVLRYAVDLAVPRDIEPAVNDLPGVQLWNVDSLGGNTPGAEDDRQLLLVGEIIEEYVDRFYKWLGYRERLHSRSEIV